MAETKTKSSGKNNAKAALAQYRMETLTKTRKKELYEEVKAEGQSAETLVLTGDLLKRSVGRPSKYTPELATRFCEGIASGHSMRTVCRDPEIPDMKTIFSWMRLHPEFLQQYTSATQERAESMHEDILDISDDGSNDWMAVNYGGQEAWITNGEALQRSKLRVETRKWLMEKMKPKKYGAKVDLTTNGKDLPTPILGGLTNQAELKSGEEKS